MSDAIISLIRTYVPVAVGGILTWLATEAGLLLDGDASTALTVGVTGLVVALYYSVARGLEKVHPWFGALLGSPKQPTYDEKA